MTVLISKHTFLNAEKAEFSVFGKVGLYEFVANESTKEMKQPLKWGEPDGIIFKLYWAREERSSIWEKI